MKITQFERAKGLYEAIKKLDAEIIDMEKAANLIANNKTDIKVVFQVNDLEEKEREQEKVSFDEDGSLIYGTPKPTTIYYTGLFSMLAGTAPKETKTEHTIKKDYTVADVVALQILGVILQQKLEERNTLIKAINKIGIEI